MIYKGDFTNIRFKDTIKFRILIFLSITMIISLAIISINYNKILNIKKEYNYLDTIFNYDMILDDLREDLLILENMKNNGTDEIDTYEIQDILKSIRINIKSIEDYTNSYSDMEKIFNNKDEIASLILQLKGQKNNLVEGIEDLFKSSTISSKNLSKTIRFIDNIESTHGKLSNSLESNLNSTIANYYIYMFTNLLVIVSVYILFILYLRKAIFHPLQSISKGFQKISKYYIGEDFEITKDDEIGYVKKSFNELRGKMNTVERLVEKISIQDSFENIFDYLFNNFQPFIPYDRIGIAVLDKSKNNIYALKAKSKYPIILGDKYSVALKNTTLNKIVITGEPRIINDLESYFENKPSSESTRLIVKEGMKSSITLPLNINEDCVGVIFFSSTERNTYNESHISFLKYIAQHIAISFEKNFVQEDLVISTINGFAKLVESKDNETGMHLERMQNYSHIIAVKLGQKEKYKNIIDNRFKEAIYNFSPLHDIGKVGIPDSILLKPGKLFNHEYDIMKTHALIGANILTDMEKQLKRKKRSFYEMGIEIVKYHHEKYDGTGYPEGLIGENIPLSARIVAIADVFDALTSARPYKKAFSLEKAVSIIEKESGNHFDPYVVEAFLESLDDIKDIYYKYKSLAKEEKEEYVATSMY